MYFQVIKRKSIRLSILFFLFVAATEGNAFLRPGGDSALYYYKKSLDKSLPFQKTVVLATKSLELGIQHHDDSLVNLIQIQLGILYWLDGEFDQALYHLDRGEHIAISRKDLFRQAQSLHYKGLVIYYRCKFDSALYWYDRADDLYQRVRNDSALAKLRSHKSLIYSAKGQYKLAAQNMIESFRLQEAIPGYRDLSVPLQFSSSANESLYYKSKLEKDLESLTFLERSVDMNKHAFTIYNIALDHQHLQNYREALAYFKAASKEYQQLHQPSFKGSIGNAYSALGQHDSAHYYLRNWIAEVKSRGTRIHLADAYAAMARSYQAQQNWKQAISYFDSALLLNERMGLKRSEALTRKEESQIYLKTHELKKALREIESSLNIVQAIGCVKDIQEFLELKADILTSLNRHKEASAALIQSKTIRDSMANGENQLHITSLQIEYETERRNRDMAELKSKNELNEAQIETHHLQIALAISLLTIIAILGGLYYYRYQQKNKAGRLLEEKNKLIEYQNKELHSQNIEKESLLHEVHHRVKNNLQIISSLINLKSHQSSSETSETLQQLSTRIFTMGLIHEKLYQKENVRCVRLDVYLAELGHHLIASFEDKSHPVIFDSACEEIEVDMDIALSCGLICNELITNSMKYAFQDDQTDRSVILRLKQVGNSLELSLADTGALKPGGGNFSKSFGLRFVDQLVKTKLAGELSLNTAPCFNAVIVFPFRQHAKN